jgi:2'-5' RNA ligase
MRLFVAVQVPEEVKKRLGQAQKELPEEGLKKVTFPRMHLTLKFLGAVSPKMLGRVGNALEEVSFSPFKVKVRGVGVFPNEKYVRVVWAGCESPELEGLAAKVNEKLGGIFPKEEFSAHLTLARVKKRVAIGEFLKKYAEEEFGEFTVREFYLVESVLGPGGPKYNVVGTYGAEG